MLVIVSDSRAVDRAPGKELRPNSICKFSAARGAAPIQAASCGEEGGKLTPPSVLPIALYDSIIKH